MYKFVEKKLNIVHISAYYPPHMGGMELVAQRIALDLSCKKNVNVQVITSDIGDKNFKKSKKDDFLKVVKLKSFEFAHTPFAPTLFWHLLRLPKDILIHLHLAQAYWPEMVWLISKLRKIPYIVHFHLDVGPSGFLGNIFLFYKRYILKYVMQSADKIIVFSKEQKKVVKSKYEIGDDKIVIIPNGVGEELFFRDIRCIPRSELKLLYVGRLAIQKRVDRLVYMLKLLDIPVKLKIVGDGESRDSLEKMALELNIRNISFEGEKNRKELFKYYHESDVFIISSDIEGMPLVVLEAMASGLPVVASNVVGLNELVNGTGILVDNPSAENFSKALKDIWNDKDSLAYLSKKSLIKAEEYSWDKIICKLELVYEELS